MDYIEFAIELLFLPITLVSDILRNYYPFVYFSDLFNSYFFYMLLFPTIVVMYGIILVKIVIKLANIYPEKE